MKNIKNTTHNFTEVSPAIWVSLIGTMSITLYFNTTVADPFNSTKLVLLVLVASWLAGHVLVQVRNIKKSKNFITLIPFYLNFLFILALSISMYFSEVKLVSFVGETQRRNGFLMYMSLAVIFLFALFNFNLKSSFLLLKLSVITGLIVASYGFLQISGNDFIDWNNPYNSMISTLGNPNFASSALAIISSICFLNLFLKTFLLNFKIFSGFISILGLFCIISSESRQGLLAFSVAIIFYFSTYLFFNFRKKSYSFILLSFLIVIFSIFGMLQKGPLVDLLYKDSVSVRGFYWRAAVEMFLLKPFTGIGIDRYGDYFRQLRELEYTRRYGYEIFSTNAHNVFLQFFATAGLFVGIFYILLQVCVLVIGMKSASQVTGDKQKILLILMAAWLAYQAQSLISIDNIGLAAWGWLLGGVILGLSRFFQIETDSLKNVSIGNYHQESIGSRFTQQLLSVIFLSLAMIFSIKIYAAESNLYKLRGFIALGIEENKKVIKDISSKLSDNDFVDPNYRFEAASVLFQLGNKSEAEKIVIKISEEDPRRIEFLNGLAFIYESSGDYVKAINYREKIVELNPWGANNYLDLIKLYKITGNLDKAIEYVNKVESFTDGNDIAKQARELIK